MINIDENAYFIELTRGDNAIITFNAKYADDTPYLPEPGDTLVFAVAKKRNAEPLFQIENPFGTFSKAEPTQDEFEADPTIYFTYNNGEYTRCTSSSTYSSSTDYYTTTFWDINIVPSHTASMKSMVYVWDLQLETADGEINTIIGETDDMNPKFKLWGEVAK